MYFCFLTFDSFKDFVLMVYISNIDLRQLFLLKVYTKSFLLLRWMPPQWRISALRLIKHQIIRKLEKPNIWVSVFCNFCYMGENEKFQIGQRKKYNKKRLGTTAVDCHNEKWICHYHFLFILVTAFGGRPKPEICIQPSNWEVETLPLTYCSLLSITRKVFGVSQEIFNLDW